MGILFCSMTSTLLPLTAVMTAVCPNGCQGKTPASPGLGLLVKVIPAGLVAQRSMALPPNLFGVVLDREPALN